MRIDITFFQAETPAASLKSKAPPQPPAPHPKKSTIIKSINHTGSQSTRVCTKLDYHLLPSPFPPSLSLILSSHFAIPPTHPLASLLLYKKVSTSHYAHNTLLAFFCTPIPTYSLKEKTKVVLATGPAGCARETKGQMPAVEVKPWKKEEKTEPMPVAWRSEERMCNISEEAAGDYCT